MLFRTDRGATGALVVSQVSPGRKNRLWFEIDGAERSLSFDQENPETLLLGGRGNATGARDRAALSAQAARLNAVPAGHPMGYRDCFAAFVRRRVRRDPGPGGGPGGAAVPDLRRRRPHRPHHRGRPGLGRGPLLDRGVLT